MRLSLAALAILLAACGNQRQVAPPAAFDRPQDVAFFCWDLGSSSAVSLSRCAPEDVEEGEPPAGLALHGLVTQTTTGELAAVRITGEIGEPGVIDTDVRIPGFTFAAVGEVPSGVAVDAVDPRQVYVTSRGSSELHTVDLPSLRAPARDGAVVNRFDFIPPSSRPSAMILAGGSLFIALPEDGQVLRVALGGDGVPDPASIELLDLSADVPEPLDLTTLDPADLPASYGYTCPDGLVQLEQTPMAPRRPQSLDAAPAPWSFALDDAVDPPQLLVADRALPIIHVIDVETFTEVEQISVSVPVREIALTPRVPDALAESGSADASDPSVSDRFLYAIDELDRSVLAVHYDRGEPAFGGVLSVNTVEPFDRLALPFGARDLEVVTPGYDPASVAACTSAGGGDDASPTDLHGVFLSVATTDGRVRFFDVYDLDTNCRGNLEGCGGGSDLASNDNVVAIGRHRPRVGVYLDEGVQIDPEPSWDTGAGAITVNADGTSSAVNLVPVLGSVACEAPLAPVYPANNDAVPLICAVADPWSATNQTWTVAYEGTIPFAGTTGANLAASSDAEMIVETRTDYCARGVIGAEDVPADGYLSAYAGDQLFITSDVSPTTINSGDEELITRCEEITERSVGGSITPLRLPILRAETNPTTDPLRESYVGRLTVGPPINVDATLAEVLECYPELVEVEVRTQGAFVAFSSIRPGFLHPIVRSDTGRCEVDQTLADELQRGRAFFDETFSSPQMSFALGGRPEQLAAPTLSFTVTQVPVPLSVDVSSIGGTGGASLLTRLEYNEVDQRLYAVDQAVQGLLRLRLTNLTVQQTFR